MAVTSSVSINSVLASVAEKDFESACASAGVAVTVDPNDDEQDASAWSATHVLITRVETEVRPEACSISGNELRDLGQQCLAGASALDSVREVVRSDMLALSRHHEDAARSFQDEINGYIKILTAHRERVLSDARLAMSSSLKTLQTRDEELSVSATQLRAAAMLCTKPDLADLNQSAVHATVRSMLSMLRTTAQAHPGTTVRR